MSNLRSAEPSRRQTDLPERPSLTGLPRLVLLVGVTLFVVGVAIRIAAGTHDAVASDWCLGIGVCLMFAFSCLLIGSSTPPP